jgi:flagellar biosynthesis/type III secretory pathway M-ring protein FliF/YscJ
LDDEGDDMTARILTVLSPFNRSWLSWIALWIAGILVLVIIVIPSESDRRLKAACDRAFETLMTTKDLVELERSKFLLDKIWCSVRGRMAAE